MHFKASLAALLMLGAPVLLAAPPAHAQGKAAAAKKAADKAAADKAAADKAAADKAAADKADADKAAADKAAADKADADKADADKATADKADADKAAAEKEKSASEAALDPFEDPNKTYRFIGLRFRDAIVPKFIINWFANGGRNVNAPMVGPEFITRKDHLEIAIALMYADYSMDAFLFQGKSDPPTSWNFAQSQLKLGYAMIDIMYEVPIEKKGEKTGRFAFLVGGGVGIAGVFGSLYQAQAYPNTPAAANNPNDPSQWRPCQGLPSEPSTYCTPRNSPARFAGPNGNLAAGYRTPNWTNGGSLPVIFPWIALPQFAFRYKPIKQFQTKLDFGFSTSGFFFGLSGSYGIPTP